MIAASRTRCPRGFTLLELMVVIVLAGILISIVSVSVTPDQRQQLAQEARRISRLLAIAAEESRLQQVPIVWEADLKGYRFVTERGGERQLLTGDELLRERNWERHLVRLAVLEPGNAAVPQVLVAADAPPVRIAVAREWIQPRWRLEITNDVAQVAVDFDETGRGSVAQP